MSKADAWMPFYIADYLRDTMHLTRDQHGAYLLLLMACWTRGGRLPNEPGQLAGMVKATATEWRKLAPVIMPYFLIEGGELVHGRVREEWGKAQRLSEARRETGKLGGRPKKEKESNLEPIGYANGNLEGLQTETPARVALPSPSPLPPEVVQDANASLSAKPDVRLVYPDLFEASWLAYPHFQGRSSKSKSLIWWKKLPIEMRDKLPSACSRFASEGREPKGETGARAMDRWLRDGLHEHWLPAEPQARSPPRPIAVLPTDPNELAAMRARIIQESEEIARRAKA